MHLEGFFHKECPSILQSYILDGGRSVLRIWFNHWFSTAYNIIEMLRGDGTEFQIIGSNENALSSIKAVCDEWYVEPVVKWDEYCDFCLDFCREHQIDVFLPRRGMLVISRRKKEFEQIGVRVMVDDYEIVNVLNHKDQAYETLKGLGVSSIPEYRIVTTVSDFAKAYSDLKQRYREICTKFVHDEGGKSFRLIDNNRKGYRALFKKQNTRMTYDDLYEALSERETFEPLMVMPNLPGKEISADCLKTEKGLIVLPRVKGPTRVEQMTFDEHILSMVREVYDAVHLECPCNIQFKELDGVYYFLEVNTRMSGGVQMACEACGVNIPLIAVHKLCGIQDDWRINRNEAYVTHVERPVVL